MVTRALVEAPLLLAAGLLLAGLCRLIDQVDAWRTSRRRLHRLASTTVVRLPSPDRRGETSPRLAAVHTHRIRR